MLCWDPVGQGERSQFWDRARGRSRYNLVCGEHAVLGNFATIAGTSLVRYMVWDGMRAVDYLLTRDDVDASGSRSRARAAAASSRCGSARSTRASRSSLPSCFPTALPMRMANRIFEDPDSDPEQDPPGLVSEGIDHPGLLLLAYPRPLHVSAAVLDFFPIEGTRKTLREVAALYRRFGHGDRVALSEGFHTHQYSAENQARAFAFLDRAFGRPAATGLGEAQTLEPEALWCTPSGQVRVDLAGRSLVEVIREDARARAPGAADDRGALPRPGLPRHPRLAGRALHRQRSARRDRLGGGRHRPGRDRARRSLPAAPRRRARDPAAARAPGGRGARPGCGCASSLDGKIGPADWAEVEARLAEGHEVVSFDPRGLGETRMRYKAASIDDPDLAPQDEDAAYASPLSGVLANYVYNAQLLGRPYLLELIEDVEIAVRFARARLGAREVTIDAAATRGSWLGRWPPPCPTSRW